MASNTARNQAPSPQGQPAKYRGCSSSGSRSKIRQPRFASPSTEAATSFNRLVTPVCAFIIFSLLITIPEAGSSVAFSKKRYHVNSGEQSDLHGDPRPPQKKFSQKARS